MLWRISEARHGVMLYSMQSMLHRKTDVQVGLAERACIGVFNWVLLQDIVGAQGKTYRMV
jgi:hypothetical protein